LSCAAFHVNATNVARLQRADVRIPEKFDGVLHSFEMADLFDAEILHAVQTDNGGDISKLNNVGLSHGARIAEMAQRRRMVSVINERELSRCEGTCSKLSTL